MWAAAPHHPDQPPASPPAVRTAGTRQALDVTLSACPKLSSSRLPRAPHRSTGGQGAVCPVEAVTRLHTSQDSWTTRLDLTPPCVSK